MTNNNIKSFYIPNVVCSCQCMHVCVHVYCVCVCVVYRCVLCVYMCVCVHVCVCLYVLQCWRVASLGVGSGVWGA